MDQHGQFTSLRALLLLPSPLHAVTSLNISADSVTGVVHQSLRVPHATAGSAPALAGLQAALSPTPGDLPLGGESHRVCLRLPWAWQPWHRVAETARL